MSTDKQKHCKSLYISHGAGPLPVLGDARHVEMVENLKHLAALIQKPKAIILVSAHWEAVQPTITSGDSPPLFFDYYGFPQEAYTLEYPAKGSSKLEAQLVDALDKGGFLCDQDTTRGFDHGMFIPLLLMYPEADVPCVQLSLLQGLDPAAHMHLGETLAKFHEQDVLVIGSGFSFHNMRAFFSPDTPQTREQNATFDSWLQETCSSKEMDETVRQERLKNWETAPHARYCHPREEHLLPLHVCYGVAGGPATKVFDLEIFGKKASAFLW